MTHPWNRRRFLQGSAALAAAALAGAQATAQRPPPPGSLVLNDSNDANYRHYDPDRASIDRRASDRQLKAVFRCCEDYGRARAITLRFKIENVARREDFELRLNGRDTRIHTVKLGPYLEYEIPLRPDQLRKGENLLQVTPKSLIADLATTVNLVEIELSVRYGAESR